ncbi:MAG: hypothetical protein K8R77_06070 [Anaerolineaceae bacterium]|nr:hypothetical protein [Anaerolineaceae bacterium]
MPLAYFICEVSGEKADPQTCLACARNGSLPGCEFTPAIIAGIINNQRPSGFASEEAKKHFRKSGRSGKIDLALSVTEALNCPRKVQYERICDWGSTPSDMYYAFRGTAFHAMAEAYVKEGPLAIAEMRLHWFFKMLGKTVGLSGCPDLITYRHDLGGWLIQDYKTIREIPKRTFRYTCNETGAIIYNVPFRIRGNTVKCPHCKVKHPNDDEHVTVDEMPAQARDSHVEQIQMYAQLITRNQRLLIDIINRRMGEKRIEKSMPVVAGEICYLDMSGIKRIPVPIWSPKERIGLVSHKIKPHLSDETPGVLTDPEDLWKCDYCPVRYQCELEHGGKVGQAALDEQIAVNEAVPD